MMVVVMVLWYSNDNGGGDGGDGSNGSNGSGILLQFRSSGELVMVVMVVVVMGMVVMVVLQFRSSGDFSWNVLSKRSRVG